MKTLRNVEQSLKSPNRRVVTRVNANAKCWLRVVCIVFRVAFVVWHVICAWEFHSLPKYQSALKCAVICPYDLISGSWFRRHFECIVAFISSLSYCVTICVLRNKNNWNDRNGCNTNKMFTTLSWVSDAQWMRCFCRLWFRYGGYIDVVVIVVSLPSLPSSSSFSRSHSLPFSRRRTHVEKKRFVSCLSNTHTRFMVVWSVENMLYIPLDGRDKEVNWQQHSEPIRYIFHVSHIFIRVAQIWVNSVHFFANQWLNNIYKMIPSFSFFTKSCRLYTLCNLWRIRFERVVYSASRTRHNTTQHKIAHTFNCIEILPDFLRAITISTIYLYILRYGFDFRMCWHTVNGVLSVAVHVMLCRADGFSAVVFVCTINFGLLTRVSPFCM